MLPRLTVITGNGKGKTAAMGRVTLAAWSGERVLVVQFLKGTGYTGELAAAQHWSGSLVIRQFGAGCLHAAEIRDGLASAGVAAVVSGPISCRRTGLSTRRLKLSNRRRFRRSGRLVLDEVSHAINKGLLDQSRFIDWLHAALPNVRLVLTGRNMPQALIALADEATECEMRSIRFHREFSADGA